MLIPDFFKKEKKWAESIKKITAETISTDFKCTRAENQISILIRNVRRRLLIHDSDTSRCKALKIPMYSVPAGSPAGGGGVAVYAFDVNQPSWPTPFHSVLVSISVFMVLSTVFHSINSPDNSRLSLTLRSRYYFCFVGPFNNVPLYESLLQP